jgi:hypothetical protein
MKAVGAVGTAVLFALFAVSPSPAQEEHRNDAQPPAQGETKPAPESHAKPQQDAKPPEGMKQSQPAEANPPRDARQGDQASHAQQDQERHAQQEQEKQHQDQARHAQQDEQQTQKEQQKQAEQGQKEQEKQAKQQQKEQQQQRDEARRAQNQEPSALQQRSRPQAQNGARIPEDRFRAHFGREHHFRVSRPTIIDGRPRFQYSGYWFEFVDSWPAAWSYDDDCYIDYVDDGYWLFDPLYPGMRIAVVVVM